MRRSSSSTAARQVPLPNRFETDEAMLPPTNAPIAAPMVMMLKRNGPMPSTSCENSTKVANAAIEAAFIRPRMIAIGRSSGWRMSQRTPSLNSDLND